jgi:putative solute:sodium symporter small subunit
VEKDYRISFFKPTTAFSKTNRNLVIVLVLIWAVAIFGFQILLRVLQEPTPESALIKFEKVWDESKNDLQLTLSDSTAMIKEKQDFASSVLSVLGKSSFYTDKNKPVLNNAFSWVVYDLVPEEEKEAFKAEIAVFEKMKENITTLTDTQYINAKKSIIAKIEPLLNLKDEEFGINKANLIPLELRADVMEKFLPENKKQIHGVMELYLTHNQSVLTDTIFLGFPFHYFYTAIFLLVLFVVLCWVYCFIIDRVHTKMGTYNKKAD